MVQKKRESVTHGNLKLHAKISSITGHSSFFGRDNGG
jgi:hypothetical protein